MAPKRKLPRARGASGQIFLVALQDYEIFGYVLGIFDGSGNSDVKFSLREKKFVLISIRIDMCAEKILVCLLCILLVFVFSHSK